jgi:ABC-type nitrate/sulfonate/bicarbonate transport system ATPase subunit
MARIQVNEVVKRYAAALLFDRLDFDVADGEFMVIIGPSGCGKSTLLRIIAGIEEMDGGSVQIGESDVSEKHPGDRDVAMVFQDYALYPHMTVEQNLSFGLRARHERPEIVREKVRSTADALGLAELLKRRPHQLSGGQRQRVALGRAMIREPRAYLMDEPLSNLDANLRVQMRAELIEFHRRTGGTILYVTHDQAEAMTMGERIAVTVRFVDRDHAIVRLSDSSGVRGYAYCLARNAPVVAALKTIAPAVIGADPAFSEAVWSSLYRSTITHGQRGVTMRAISLVDIALDMADGRGRGGGAAVARPVRPQLGRGPTLAGGGSRRCRATPPRAVADRHRRRAVRALGVPESAGARRGRRLVGRHDVRRRRERVQEDRRHRRRLGDPGVDPHLPRAHVHSAASEEAVTGVEYVGPEADIDLSYRFVAGCGRSSCRPCTSDAHRSCASRAHQSTSRSRSPGGSVIS